MALSAVDTISLAFQHTKRQLVQPFRFGQWTRLAFVGLLAGEMGSGGGVHVPSGFSPPTQGGGGSAHPTFPGIPHIDPSILFGLLAVIFITGLVFFLVMTYIGSVMRFILFDSILAKECRIRDSWHRRQEPGWKYFLWHLAFLVVVLVGMVVILGLPAAIAWFQGWFKSPREHLLPLILGGIILFFLFFAFFVLVAVTQVLTKDFVVPQMALEGIDAFEGWRRLWPMIQLEKGSYAVYIGMKIVLAMGFSIVIGVAGIILTLVFAVPVVAAVIAAIFAGKTAGLSWNAFTITTAIVAGCVLFAIYLYLIALISVPAIVFFPAYSIYFFAPRYRPLSLVLYPLPHTAEPQFSMPPEEPPPLPA